MKFELKKIFSPSVFLMSRFHYPQKFLIISILFAIPIALGAYFFVTKINEEIKTIHFEQNGLRYITPTQKLLKDVQQHRGLTSIYLGGNTAIAQSLTSKGDEVEQDFLELERVDAEVGSLLRIKSEPSRIRDMKNEWNEIEQAFDKGTLTLETSFRTHTNLRQNIIFFMDDIADKSDLGLERHLDTSYLIEIFINRIPVISESMAQLRVSGLMLPAGKSLSSGEKQIFISLSNTANSYLQKTNRQMNAVFQENPALQSDLETVLNEMTEATETLLQTIDEKIIQTDINTIEQDAFYASTTHFIDKVFDFYTKAVPVLDSHLKEHVDELERQRNILFFAVGISLFLVIYLFIGFYLGVKMTIDNLRSATGRMLKGDNEGGVSLNTKDEFGEIANAFNIIINALIVSNSNLKDNLAKKEAMEKVFNEQTEKLKNNS